MIYSTQSQHVLQEHWNRRNNPTPRRLMVAVTGDGGLNDQIHRLAAEATDRSNTDDHRRAAKLAVQMLRQIVNENAEYV